MERETDSVDLQERAQHVAKWFHLLVVTLITRITLINTTKLVRVVFHISQRKVLKEGSPERTNQGQSCVQVVERRVSREADIGGVDDRHKDISVGGDGAFPVHRKGRARDPRARQVPHGPVGLVDCTESPIRIPKYKQNMRIQWFMRAFVAGGLHLRCRVHRGWACKHPPEPVGGIKVKVFSSHFYIRVHHSHSAHYG